MMQGIPARILLLIGTIAVVAHAALDRPAAPTISSVTFNASTQEITIAGTMSEGDSCHAVLVTDLSVGLGAAYAVGNAVSLAGSAVNYAQETLPLVIELDDKSRERYFIAIASSKVDANKLRVFSPWKIFTDANGLPLAISTGHDALSENLIYRARKIDPANDSVVIDVTFSLPASQTTNSKLMISRQGIPLLTISDLSSVSNSKHDIREAINSPSGITNTLVMQRDTLGFSLYSVYLFTSLDAGDSINVELIKSDSTLADTAQRKIGVIEDAAHRNMISTIYTLCRMPAATPDPIYPGALGNLPDSNRVKLLITAMLDRAVAHNSPLGVPEEEDEGIFTNYMQLFDDVVRNWENIDSSAVGMPRLAELLERALAINGGDVVDPVYVKNYGTLSDYGQPEPKRKNYAFVEGYSRLYYEMDRSPYTTGQKSGAGLMFRISDNVELYTANMADTFNMFDEPFLSGGSTDSSRIIFRMNDTLIDTMDTNGVWVKGKELESGEKVWYCGMAGVRLPIQGGPVPIRQQFAVNSEKAGKGDPQGTIVGGEKSVLKVYEIVNYPAQRAGHCK